MSRNGSLKKYLIEMPGTRGTEAEEYLWDSAIGRAVRCSSA